MKVVITSLLLFITFIAYSQAQADKIEQLKALGRDSLVVMANQKVLNNKKFSGFDPKSYDHINVYIEGDALYVLYRRNVMFSPMNSSYIYSVTVYLTDASMSWSSLTNPKDKKEENSHTFYQPGKDQEEALQIIYKTAKIPRTAEVTIYDHPDFYEVAEMWDDAVAFYKVNKKTSKVYDEEYEQLEPMEEEESDLIEIKE